MEIISTLDCTGGWYSTQTWHGVSVAQLLNFVGVMENARSLTFESITGYKRRFSLDQARGYLLATEVAGMRLSHLHGAPVRLVAPDRRGLEWVKWLVRLHVNISGAFYQSPLPLQ